MVSSFIRAAEEVVKEIEEATEKRELNELVLMIICNRLDFSRLDEATPAMRLLNDLLNMHDGFDDEGWLKEFKNRMVDTFPRENLFSVLVPAGNEINKERSCVRVLCLA
ncbi:protein PALE CRESS, chloroplastic-like [Quercus lobata]|uniref:protein PALE CRESS, chloroplastic-like n=1 Tax=Quercus lobata TaxID=97700 RepID=UPI0012484813|nr:protein PALE CRESS, chloroplastic-like [Quercus lobata]